MSYHDIKILNFKFNIYIKTNPSKIWKNIFHIFEGFVSFFQKNEKIKLLNTN